VLTTFRRAARGEGAVGETLKKHGSRSRARRRTTKPRRAQVIRESSQDQLSLFAHGED